METRSLHHNYPGTQVIAAYVLGQEPGLLWSFTIICDEEAKSSTGNAMSTRLSKQYASYDEAVLGMNEKLAILMVAEGD